MESLQRIFVWLSRWNKCRGFGVQSPWAYQMIRYVINEHWPYYAYEEFEQHVPAFPDRIAKMGRLYFRLANFRQPSAVLCFPACGDYELFFQRGCNKCIVETVDGEMNSQRSSLPVLNVELLRISPAEGYQKVLMKAVEKADENTIVVVEDIHKNKSVLDFWKHVVEDERVVITFDLYYCGIIFFQKRRYKENYIVNF